MTSPEWSAASWYRVTVFDVPPLGTKHGVRPCSAGPGNGSADGWTSKTVTRYHDATDQSGLVIVGREALAEVQSSSDLSDEAD